MNRLEISKYLFLSLVISSCFIALSCTKEIEKPDINSEAYKKAVSDFYLSLAAIQSDQALFAVEKMQAVADQYPPEAAAWANMGVFAMRQGNFELAGERLDKARDLSPDNADIAFLNGILESRKGNIDASLDHLKEAARLDSSHVQILYALADELERQDSEANKKEISGLFNRILNEKPDNLAVLLEMVRTSVKWNDQSMLNRALDALSGQAGNWPEEVQRQFQDLKETILNKESDNMTFELAFLRNNLSQLSRFQYDLAQVELPPNQVGFLVTDFLWLPRPSVSAAPKDEALAFTPEPLGETTGVDLTIAAGLYDREIADVITVKGSTASINDTASLSFPASQGPVRYSPSMVSTLDYNYDFRNDLVFAGPAGLKLYEMQEDSTFGDVTSQLQIPAAVIGKSYKAVWSRDVDSDGDLDIILSPVEGNAGVLRNNGDGTFNESGFFEAVNAPEQFVWADLDRDGDADAVFLDGNGHLQLLRNERMGTFVKKELPGTEGENFISIGVADIDSDGFFDIVTWSGDGIDKITYRPENEQWERHSLISLKEEFNLAESDKGYLYVIDLDNNGADDILASGPGESRFWLSSDSLSLSDEGTSLAGNILSIADVNGDTRLDLISLDEKGTAVRLINEGSKDYKARVIRPRASGSFGDQRINSFGIGGEIEIRSGLLYEKQLIQEPWVHLGLGTYEEAEMLRIIWPNGSVQAEFAELGYGSKIFNEQILKGSCPWVFAYNGDQMEFITDFLWRTGLGLRINAQGDANVIHSIDWIKIGGDQLKPRDGQYDIRITADLWETHFFDHVSLMAVEHPKDTEVFVDERFTFPPRKPQLYALEKLQPVAKAIDQDGNDVTGKIRYNDRDYVDSFKLTKYQGIAEEHYLEVDLGENIPENEKVRLVASGWIYPTDTSVNIAISQGSKKPPHGIRLEVPDGKGGWKVAKKDIGFPAGKSKTMLIDVADIFEPGTDQRVRLVTNMEIYWNRMQWAVEHTETDVDKKELAFSETELRYRGFSEVKRPSRFEPEQPNYRQINGTTPMWIDLVGFYTRFGEVDELVEKIDDRYVIMNAGDELVFKFPTLNPPEGGRVRDFVLVGDGWVKDGDLNTGFSKTVLPLPYHGMEDYAEAPGTLQEDPVFQNHKEDWVNYHTRYITPRNFYSAIKFGN